MPSQGACELGESGQAGAQRIACPGVEQASGPVGGGVAPEGMEFLLEQIGADGAQVDAHELAQPSALLVGEVVLALEQHPSRVLERDAVTTLAQLAHFSSAHLVDGLAEQLHDVEAVEHRAAWRRD